jgi:predicted permease
MTSIPAIASIYATLTASIKSVGTACTLAAVGVYLDRRGFVRGEGLRTLAVLSQQVTFPLFLFTKIIYCNQDWSDEPCPDVTKSLMDVWMLVLWPAVVVGLGIVVGWFVIHLAKTPKHQQKAVLAACAFGNSSGLPITLLTVVHTNFPTTSDLGRIDPTLFLSVYLLLYPVLQWGLGGWLLAPEGEDENDSGESDSERGADPALENKTKGHRQYQRRRSSAIQAFFSLRKNVLNNNIELQQSYVQPQQLNRRGFSSSDEERYTPVPNQPDMTDAENQDLMQRAASIPPPLTEYGSGDKSFPLTQPATPSKNVTPLKAVTPGKFSQPVINPMSGSAITNLPPPLLEEQRAFLYKSNSAAHNFEGASVWETFKKVLHRCFQPPVIGAILGIFIALIKPLRGVFVDLENRQSGAALQWFFDGLYSVGLTAVPINMIILGCNLSASMKSRGKETDDEEHSSFLPRTTMYYIVVGKMLVLPLIGISLTYILKRYFWDIPESIDGSVYLVLMIVFLTPTANNVMVMIELSGSKAKQGIARYVETICS